jgi:hypothetical protein
MSLYPTHCPSDYSVPVLHWHCVSLLDALFLVGGGLPLLVDARWHELAFVCPMAQNMVKDLVPPCQQEARACIGRASLLL